MAIADITKPMALDETLQATNTALGTLNTTNGSLAKDASLNTTESTPRSIADVLAEELGRIADVVKPDADDVDYDNTSSGLSATNVQEAIDEIKAGIDETGATKTEASEINGNIVIDDVETPVYRNYGNNTVLTTDKTPFLTRQTLNPTGFSSYVREKLIGCSVAWNQLVNGNFENYTKTSGSTITKSGDTYTFTKSGTQSIMYDKEANVVVPIGHKILIIFKGLTTSVYASLVRSNSNTTDLLINPDTPYLIHQVANNDVYGFGLYLNANLASSVSWKTYQCIDLTLAFGSTIADYLYGLSDNGGITKLRDMGCPIDSYTAYGNYLVSSKTSGKKIVGFNLFDEKWEASSANVAVGSKIKVLPNTTYYGKFFNLSQLQSSRALYFAEYDKDDNLVSANNCTVASPQYSFTTKSNTAYVKPQVNHGGDISNINSITFNCCLNLYKNTGIPKNGDYEPYSTTTYSLGNDELRGKFDLVNNEIVASGDVKESNGKITRNWFTDINLGDLTWMGFGSSYPNCFYATITGGINSASNTGSNKGVCAKYTVVAKDITALADKECTFGSRNVYANEGSIMLKDTAYSDAATLKTSLSGLYATCAKQTPTTVQSTPFADPMSLVGATTEEYIDTRDIPCPVGAERQYMGQSEDIIPIPSTPQSDGVWVQKCYVSGGKAHYVWELES